ncbi:MAG: ATP-binding protein [Rhodocyclaceae bacterium]|nr:ATP-binding protein [Rhodocyclaceae bacterium]MCA3061192.1 ATP-binding protein [Rhodocyclaceae bacterium]MCA3087372.1 ATP-binding protein [Rhodocyclaceae bacterium]
MQCKHWVESGFASLLRHLRNSELPKIAKLNPQRYVLATSVPLNPMQKDMVVAALCPWLRAPSDVLGPSDLNLALSTHSFIETRHHKLWLQSSNLLALINGRGLHLRNKYWLDQIQRFSRRHVRTASFQNALGLLENNHVILVSGEPGSGKTTLAEQACLWLVGEGFQFVRIDESISEAEQQYLPEEKQVFYFDDFLGRNFLDALNSRESSRVINFIRRVRADESKRFILTTRTTILNQARERDERFTHLNPEAHELAVRVTAMSPIERAKVLFSNIWYTIVEPERRSEILSNTKYRQVVNHKNFSPRIIALFCKNFSAAASHEEFWDALLRELDDPAHFWDQPYRNEIGQAGQWAISLLALHAGEMKEQPLLAAMDRAIASRVPLGSSPISAQDSVKPLIGPFLVRRAYSDDDIWLDLCSPSLGDFVILKLVQDISYLVETLIALRSSTAIENMRSFVISGQLSRQKYVSALELIVERIHERHSTQFNAEFQICLADQLLAAEMSGTKSRDLLRQIARGTTLENWLGENGRAIRFVVWAHQEGIVSDSDALQFLEHVDIHAEPMEYCEQLVRLRGALLSMKIDVSSADTSLRDQLISYWYEEIDDDLLDSGALASAEDESLEHFRELAVSHLAIRLRAYPFGFERHHFEQIVSHVGLSSVWRLSRSRVFADDTPTREEDWENFLEDFEEIDEVFAHT